MTAFEHHAVSDFKANALDYLTKAIVMGRTAIMCGFIPVTPITYARKAWHRSSGGSPLPSSPVEAEDAPRMVEPFLAVP